MMRNTIHVGDNLSFLRTLPDACVDLCVTSPPYYQLRDYQHTHQVGRESSVAEYIQTLVELFTEVARVLTPAGSCWVNLGDTYHQKRLLQVPSRFELAMGDAGWCLRNEIIWQKPNPQPMSAKHRFWVNHEKFFWFVKHPDRYYFDQQAILVPQAEISIRRMFSQNHLEKRKDAGATEQEGFAISSVQQERHYARRRASLGIEKDFDYDALVASGRCPMRPTFTVWPIASTTYAGAHFAVYPPELIRMPIRACAPVGGLVLDPFLGSGTTALVAQQEHRDYVGCELNPEYAALASARLVQTPAGDSTLFDEPKTV